MAGDDTVWISNFAGAVGRIAHLCGVKTENCPPGMKTGDQISPPDGYVGGGLQMQTDLAIDPAGNVWVIDNWQDINSCFDNPPEGLSTRCGGHGSSRRISLGDRRSISARVTVSASCRVRIRWCVDSAAWRG